MRRLRSDQMSGVKLSLSRQTKNMGSPLPAPTLVGSPAARTEQHSVSGKTHPPMKSLDSRCNIEYFSSTRGLHHSWPRTVFTVCSLGDTQVDTSELFMSFDWSCQSLGLPNLPMRPFLKDSQLLGQQEPLPCKAASQLRSAGCTRTEQSWSRSQTADDRQTGGGAGWRVE